MYVITAHAGYEPISPEKHILSFLWYVGHESAGYRDVADRFGITISTMYNVISRVTNFLLSLAPNVIRFPTLQEREVTKQFFLQKNKFPGVIGIFQKYYFHTCKILIISLLIIHYRCYRWITY